MEELNNSEQKPSQFEKKIDQSNDNHTYKNDQSKS